MSIESVCNQALDLVGYKRHIGNIWEGTVAARIALDCWAETRDAALHNAQPQWARRDAAMTLLKSAPAGGYVDVTWNATYPTLPWLYEYQAPDDCIVPLQVKPRPLTLPVWRPRYEIFRTQTNASGYTILTDVTEAILTYIWRVTDPDLWHEDFTEMVIRALAQKFSTALAVRPPERNDADEA